ncbi:MAG TPA: hypothetical protein PLL69_12775, partial [Gemmatimonadales bacterium]|nr:hypothetical protein [Gemmatimonadales bacterium]
MSGIPYQAEPAGAMVELRGSLDRARSARRRRLFLHGLQTLLAVGLAALVLLMVAIRLLEPGAGTVALLRIGFFALVAVVVVRWLLMPMLHRSSDAMLARYIEERHPPFRQALITAVDWMADPAVSGESTELRGRVLAAAGAEMGRISDGRLLEATGSSRALARLGAVAGLWLALLLLLPSGWRTLLH